MGEPFNAARLINVPWPDGLNCYSFAARCDRPKGFTPGMEIPKGVYYCLPGAKAGVPVRQGFKPKALVDACIADGFDYTGWGGGPQPPCPESHYLMAVFTDRNSYHFARQERDGQWVHKPSARQLAHNMVNSWLLGTDLSNVPWAPAVLITYLRAPWSGVVVASGSW